MLNEHFGWAKQFVIYEINENKAEFVRREELPGGDDRDEENKINARVDALNDVHIVYVMAIGPAAATKLVKARIHPVKSKMERPIQEIVNEMHEMIKKNPPPWIQRILHMEKEVINT